MSEPVVTQKTPFALELTPGSYSWCACGRSRLQPFCDGSHQGTDIFPVKFEIVETGTVWLCGCKHTQSPPLCDGSHNRL